jgi:hypothetical protein
MLGGGIFVTQNKTLPGSYINFVSTQSTSSALGERGVVAIALTISNAPSENVGKVIELNGSEFVTKCKALFGVEFGDKAVAPLREIFCNSNKVYVYLLGADETVSNAVNAFEPYEFNVLCAYTDDSADATAYITAVKGWRDDMGKKCQVVVYNQTAPDHEGVINVVSTVSDEGADAHALTAWVSGAEAACSLNQSCTNKLYNGEYTIVTNKTQKELEDCISNGQVAFHLVYGEVRMLEDVNSLQSTSLDKGDDFKNNQTIRIVDQIANDIAKLFNTKYLGKIPNNDAGRTLLWGDIVEHHRDLQTINAIENFDSSLLTVEQGDTKRSVVVTDVITVTNAMSQLYMTVVVQ